MFDTKPDSVYVTHGEVASVIHLSLLPTSFTTLYTVPLFLN